MWAIYAWHKLADELKRPLFSCALMYVSVYCCMAWPVDIWLSRRWWQQLSIAFAFTCTVPRLMSFHCVLLPAMFPIQSIQNLIVINTFVTRRDPSIRDILHCLPIRQWVEFKTCVLVNNCLHNISPSYLSSMCQPISKSTPAADTISCTRRPRRPGQKKTVCYGPRSFAIAGTATWNSLPASLCDDQQSIATFRRLLKTELFSRAYDSSLARSWLLLTVKVGEHNFNYYYYYYYYKIRVQLDQTRSSKFDSWILKQ